MHRSLPGKIAFIGAFLVIFLAIGCSGRGDIDISKATPLGVEPTSDSGSPGAGVPGKLFSFQPGQQVSYSLLADGSEVGGSPIINDFDGDGMDNTAEITTNIWSAEVPQITTRVVTPVTMQVEALSYQTGLTDLKTYSVSGSDLNGEKSSSSERFYRQTLSAHSAQLEKFHYPSGAPSGQVSDFVTPGLGYLSLVGQSSGYSNGSSWAAYSQVSPLSVINIDGGFAADVNVFNWVFKDDFSANAAAQYRIWKREKEASSYQIGSNAGTVRIAMYIKNSGSNVPVRLSNILAALVFETRQGGLVTAANFRLRDVSLANLYSLEMNANTEFGPYLIEVPNISTDLIEKAIRDGYTPQVRLLDYELTHPTNSPYRLSLNFTGDNLKVMDTNAKSRTAKINIIGPATRQTYQVAAFATSTENATDACAPVTAPDASSTASPGVPLTRALDRAACSMAVGGKVGGVPVIEYEQYVLDFTGVPVYDNLNPKIVYVNGIKRIGDVVNNVNCDAAYTNVCYVRFSEYLTNPNNNFAIWTVFAKGKYFNYSQFDYINTSGSGTVRGYPSGSFNSNTRTGAIPRLKGVNSTIWAGDQLDVVYMKVSDIIALRGEPGGTPMESGVTLSFNTKWDNSTVGNDPYAPNVHSKFIGKATLGDTIEVTFDLKDTMFLNPEFANDIDPSATLALNQFRYSKGASSKKFSIDQAVDFELNLGVGNQQSDWQNVLRGCPMRPTAIGAGEIQCVKAVTDFTNQRFVVQLKLPANHPMVMPGDLVSLYLRPALSNAYRNSIWPQDYRFVRKFDSLVVDAPVGGNVIRVGSGHGNIADIQPNQDVLKVVTDSGLATFLILSVSQAGGTTYEFALSTPVSSVISAGSAVYVEAGLASPHLTLRADANASGVLFFDFFNAANPAKPLAINQAVDCNAERSATGCYGMLVSGSRNYLVDNWLGNVSLENNWSDATVFGLNTGSFSLPYLLSPSLQDVSFALRSLSVTEFFKGADGQLSSELGHLQLAPQLKQSNDRAIAIWQATDSNGQSYVAGRIIDLNTGLPLGPSDLQITQPAFLFQLQASVAVNGDTALVVWSIMGASNVEIRGRFVDLRTGQFHGAGDFLLSSPSINDNLSPRAAFDGSRGIVVWHTINSDLSDEIRGRFVDVIAHAPIGLGDFPISTSNNQTQSRPQVIATGNTALIIWDSNDNALYNQVRIRFADLQNAVLFGATDAYLSQEISGAQEQSAILKGGTHGIIAWKSTTGIRARSVDLVARAISSTDQSLTASAMTSEPTLAVDDQKVFVAWTTSGSATGADIQGRFFSFPALLPLGSGFIPISTTAGNDQTMPVVAMSANRVLISWHSMDNGSNLDIRARVLDAQSMSPMQAQDFLLSATSSGMQQNPGLAIWGSKAFSVWQSDHTAGINHIWRAILTLPGLVEEANGPIPFGSNNFFTSPLIERNYTATASIVK